MKPTQKQIDDVMNECCEAQDNERSKFSGMSYEQGVEAAIRWMEGLDSESPLED